jgi:mRNA interferase MazF
MLRPLTDLLTARCESGMAHLGLVSRWEIYWVDLEPHVGSEQGGERRPAIVVSNDGFNPHFEVVTVVPLTKREGKKRKIYPFEVLSPDLIGTGHESIVMPQQVRTISKLRLIERIGAVGDEGLRDEIENRLIEHLGIEFEPEEP